jgi:predicted deacylase
MASDRLHLPSPAPGTERHLRVHRFGRPGARPKAYIQAALHADEIPGLLVAQHLLPLLERADAEGGVRGEVVLVPVANPVGLAQSLGGRLIGRYDLDAMGNFNRDFPDLTGAALARAKPRLGGDPQANVAAVRAALAEAAAELPAVTETAALKKTLLGLAVDADLVLDLHCAGVALEHLYGTGWQRDQVTALGADLGSRAVLLDGPEGSGQQPFDEACHSPWWKLRGQLPPDQPLPLACLAVTVELRGQADVEDPLAAADAAALVRILQRHGILAGDPGPAPAPRCAGTPSDGVEILTAPAAGVVVYRRRLGEAVRAGDLIAEIVDPLGQPWGAARTPVHSTIDGLLFNHATSRMLRLGQRFCRIAGAEPLAARKTGLLLGD